MSDDGQWYYSGFRWKPLVDNSAPSGKPTPRDEKDVRPLLGRTGGLVGAAGRGLVKEIARVGSLAAVENAIAVAPTPQRVERYDSAKDAEKDARKLAAQGWRVVSQSAVSGHVNARRTAARVATGGFLIGGASRSKDQVIVVYERA